MPHRRIVIGDVHGHYDTLLNLLDEIAPNEEDKIYFLGDLIDRGPQSQEVINFVKDNDYSCLLGNHEQMLLNTLGEGEIDSHQLQGWLYGGGYPTLLSYEHHIPIDHINWLKSLPLYLDLGDIWLVHAGVHPTLPLEEQTTEHFCWIRDAFHSINEPYFPDKLIITGHTITFTFPGVLPGKLVSGAGWLDIDTGAYHPHSGWLTALDVTNEQVYQIHRKTKTKRVVPLSEAVVSIDPSSIIKNDQRTL
ncbi:metallophosphoesterase family protein [Aphanothece sacrum]|uniref:Bis(5'nucleosyl)-tetraphosphatase ApaH n=1 Tax=Aphanothece sacrum FPU1 TaxID=1920663 RepID=A0A401IL55_APHSA|nr:metallophosphoesterase family protein [Aphanothece sacrum]GBF81984.1 Bis(5'nucleosyl)-tetraphosphatase ApaH [Aphanothece sacrum FPU1]GBF83614.1 bis(5'nucleosyl)-tetraphosphatase ApaH [Aphanothece sacrum FPU3]